jgi:hypothetical protein
MTNIVGALSILLAFEIGVSNFTGISRAQAQSVAATPSALGQIAYSFSKGQPIQGIQLLGFATLTSGSLEDTGAATLTVSADGSWKTQFSFNQIGQRTELRTTTEGQRDCSWSSADGVSHDTDSICWTALAWFLPQMSLQPGLIASTLNTRDRGLVQTPKGARHVIESSIVLGSKNTKSSVAPIIQRQSSTTLNLDPSTSLPMSLEFKQPSDSGIAQIAVEIRYSNYKQISGVLLPTRIERYVNGGLELSIEVTQARVTN